MSKADSSRISQFETYSQEQQNYLPDKHSEDYFTVDGRITQSSSQVKNKQQRVFQNDQNQNPSKHISTRSINAMNQNYPYQQENVQSIIESNNTVSSVQSRGQSKENLLQKYAPSAGQQPLQQQMIHINEQKTENLTSKLPKGVERMQKSQTTSALNNQMPNQNTKNQGYGFSLVERRGTGQAKSIFTTNIQRQISLNSQKSSRGDNQRQNYQRMQSESYQTRNFQQNDGNVISSSRQTEIVQNEDNTEQSSRSFKGQGQGQGDALMLIQNHRKGKQFHQCEENSDINNQSLSNYDFAKRVVDEQTNLKTQNLNMFALPSHKNHTLSIDQNTFQGLKSQLNQFQANSAFAQTPNSVLLTSLNQSQSQTLLLNNYGYSKHDSSRQRSQIRPDTQQTYRNGGGSTFHSNKNFAQEGKRLMTSGMIIGRQEQRHNKEISKDSFANVSMSKQRKLSTAAGSRISLQKSLSESKILTQQQHGLKKEGSFIVAKNNLGSRNLRDINIGSTFGVIGSQSIKTLPGINQIPIIVSTSGNSDLQHQDLHLPQTLRYQSSQAGLLSNDQISKDQRLELLRFKKAETENKLKAKLNIYASVRPKNDQKDLDRVKKDYKEQIERHAKKPQIDRLYSVIPHQLNYVPPQSAMAAQINQNNFIANLPKTLAQSQQQQRIKLGQNLIQGESHKQAFDQQDNTTTVCSTENIQNRHATTASTFNNQNSIETFGNYLNTESRPSPTNASRISFAKSHQHFRSTTLLSKLTTSNHQQVIASIRKQKWDLDDKMNQFIEGDLKRLIGQSERIEDWFATEDESSKGSPQKSKLLRSKFNETNLTALNSTMLGNEKDSQSLNDEGLEQSLIFKLVLKGDGSELAKALEQNKGSKLTLNQKRKIINTQELQHSSTTLADSFKARKFGRSIIFYAISLRKYEIVEILLRNGGDIVSRDLLGRNILHYAVMMGCEKNIIDMILTYQKMLGGKSFNNNDLINKEHQLERNKSLESLENDEKQKNSTSVMISNQISKQSFIGITDEGQVQFQDDLNNHGKNHSNSNELLKIHRALGSDRKSSMQINQFQDTEGNISSLKQPSIEQSQSQGSSTFSPTGFQRNKASLFTNFDYNKSLQQNTYVNGQDKMGRTALHYAVLRQDLRAIQILIQQGADFLLIDILQKKPHEYAEVQQIKEFFNSKGQQINKSTMSPSQADKQKINGNRESQNSSMIKSNLKSQLRVSTSESPSRLLKQKNLELSSIEALAQFSNTQLQQFIYGIYGDNALTYMIRVDDKKKFQYLLKRGMLASQSDLEGNNALHYAVRMERLEYLCYLIEGDYHSSEDFNDPNFKPEHSKLNATINNITVNKSYMMGTQSQLNHSNVGHGLSTTQVVGSTHNVAIQLDSLLCLDQSNHTDGYTPIHEAAKIGNIQILQYLVNIIKRRNIILNSHNLSTKKKQSLNQSLRINLESMKSIKDVYEFTDYQNMTPLLIAAKYNHFEILKFLVNEGANVYAQCQMLQNCLHYAVQNENEQMIRYLLFADAESGLLKNECNFRNQKPESFDTNKKYAHLFANIWEAVTIRSQSSYDKINYLLRNYGEIYQADSKTLIGQNTPLHFAVMYNNARALRILVQALPNSKSLEILNADGKTPKDLARLHANQDDRQRLMLVLNRDFTLAQQTVVSPSFRKRKLGASQSKFSVSQITDNCQQAQNSSPHNQSSAQPGQDSTNIKHLQYQIRHQSPFTNKFDPIYELIEGDEPLPQKVNNDQTLKVDTNSFGQRCVSQEQTLNANRLTILTDFRDKRSARKQNSFSENNLTPYLNNSQELTENGEESTKKLSLNYQEQTSSNFNKVGTISASQFREVTKNQVKLITEPDFVGDPVSREKDSSHQSQEFNTLVSGARESLKLQSEHDGPESIHNDSPLLNQTQVSQKMEIETFINLKQQEYLIPEKRLGKFNPDLYQKICYSQTYDQSKRQIASPSFTSNNQSLNSSFVNGQGMHFNFKRQQSTARRKQQVEDLFGQLDLKCRKFIDCNTINDSWHLFQAMMGENECNRLKCYLERYYQDTKITLSSFFKIMNFYISE